MPTELPDAVVYTETVVHAAPARFADEAPYQIAIVETAAGERKTVRIAGEEPVRIGDQVIFAGYHDGFPVYRAR